MTAGDRWPAEKSALLLVGVGGDGDPGGVCEVRRAMWAVAGAGGAMGVWVGGRKCARRGGGDEARVGGRKGGRGGGSGGACDGGRRRR